MDIVFNELSTNYLAINKDLANQWMLVFFSSTETLSKRIHKEIFIRTTKQLKDIFIAPNYSFGEWLHTLKDRDLLRRIIKSLTNRPLIGKYPYYNFQNIECDGLALAFQEDTFAISYPENIWGQILEITKEFFNSQNEVVSENICVKNISCNDHVYFFFPKRIFEHHVTKHDIKRRNLNDGESTLFYNIPAEQSKVQKLLDTAIGEQRLYNWDELVGKYIEFNFHGENVLHGYHIEDKNRVPDSIKKMITAFINK